MAESDPNTSLFGELKNYDYVKFIVPDLNGVPRGKAVTGKFKEKYAKYGLELYNGVLAGFGPQGRVVHPIFEVTGPHFPNNRLQPCLDTLTPCPWLGDGRRKVGTVHCDFLFPDGTPDLTSPRELLKTQLDSLRAQHGLVIKTAFEYEFMVYDKATNRPTGPKNSQLADMQAWDSYGALFFELNDVLEEMGIAVSSWMPESGQGQMEFTTDPVEGMRGADLAYYAKTAVKGFFPTKGYYATFMGKTEQDQASCLHLNHSLWRPDKHGDGGEVSVMSDAQDPYYMSTTAKHWMAGLMAHAPALTALFCPTTNCYRRLRTLVTPADMSWGGDDRKKMIRVKTTKTVVQSKPLESGYSGHRSGTFAKKSSMEGSHGQSFVDPRSLEAGLRQLPASVGQRSNEKKPKGQREKGDKKNIQDDSQTYGEISDKENPQNFEASVHLDTYIEHRLPSAAVNPYIAIAALVAAGLDGLDRKLECSPPSDTGRSDQCQPLAKSLREALVALEEDQRLREVLGERFVRCYISHRLECDVKPMEEAGLTTEEEMLEFEKKLYLDII